MAGPMQRSVVHSSHQSEAVFKKPQADISHTVKVSSLENMIKWLSANNDSLLKEEFKDLADMGYHYSSDEALRPHNAAKNRYCYNYVTYDHSRVELESTGEDGSDYINASWIMGEGGQPKVYIAAQAPLHGTVSDMWRMIWEYRIQVILMITTLTENGHEKCVKYWPDNEDDIMCVNSSRLGVDLRIVLNTSETDSHWKYSTITVEETDDPLMEPLIVHHYHFTAWPDRGVPSSFISLLHLLHHIHTTHLLPTSHTSTDHPPLLVHCSAGVGRTGTLLAVDRLVKKLQAGAREINVFKTVKELRWNRPGMVQNAEQYKFIYSCLAYVNSYGLTKCCCEKELISSDTTVQLSPQSSGDIKSNYSSTPLEH